jgi:hypothetical protein
VLVARLEELPFSVDPVLSLVRYQYRGHEVVLKGSHGSDV